MRAPRAAWLRGRVLRTLRKARQAVHSSVCQILSSHHLTTRDTWPNPRNPRARLYVGPDRRCIILGSAENPICEVQFSIVSSTKKDSVRPIPLGGIGEIGKNMLVVECGSDIIVSIRADGSDEDMFRC